jgi:hypothetical protein
MTKTLRTALDGEAAVAQNLFVLNFRGGLPQPKPLSGIGSEEEDESEVHRKAERNL